ncbi:antibiotic biosynthesis monooxygenase [Sphaerisporangium corydalis]|uniref:Antibiotic biosynthesis monooxygenase n=1 Tax=Sphaerisporangium corydalis TaxID=1441875 RepID=A0ABV9ELZ1_9ACTN|nr:antibiotic biosynthesis monooxygenase [Sphaerisporangium corydalis]
MEVLVAVTAFAGALFAAITTGILVGRLRDERSGWLIAWTITTSALCLALGAVAIGHLMGFGPTTFRIYQITGAFLAPFWLAIGMIQMIAEKAAARFASWLLGIAFTLVTVVIMVLDPISEPEKFGKTLPLGDTHWTIIPTSLLNAAHGLTYLILIGCLILAVFRWRGGDDVDADNMHAGVVLAPTGLALVGAVRFAIPGVFAALVITLMVGAVWYAVARPLAPYDEERDGADDDDWDDERPPVRRAADPDSGFPSGPLPVTTVSSAMPPPPRRSGLGDLVAEYRAGDQGDVDFAARMQPSGAFGGPRTGEFIGPDGSGDPLAGQGRPGQGMPGQGMPGQGMPGQGMPGGPLPGQGLPGGPVTGQGLALGSNMPGMPGQSGGWAQQGRNPMPGDQGQYGRPGPLDAGMAGHAGQNGSHRAPGQPPEYSMPATGALFPGNEIKPPFGHPEGSAVRRTDMPLASAGPVRPSPSIYGLLTVFTLMDGMGEAFDRLAEETVEAVRRSEPDTLIFICHAVKSAPLQRIVYELYRDEVAFTEHQRQPHMERFSRERVAHVLAANVIELNVNAAKVVPLPTAFHV